MLSCLHQWIKHWSTAWLELMAQSGFDLQICRPSFCATIPIMDRLETVAESIGFISKLRGKKITTTTNILQSQIWDLCCIEECGLLRGPRKWE